MSRRWIVVGPECRRATKITTCLWSSSGNPIERSSPAAFRTAAAVLSVLALPLAPTIAHAAIPEQATSPGLSATLPVNNALAALPIPTEQLAWIRSTYPSRLACWKRNRRQQPSTRRGARPTRTAAIHQLDVTARPG